MVRIEVDVTALPVGRPYAVLNTCVLPRPIAWVSTLSAAGVPNLAPHSYFTVASSDPPIISFTSIGVKDSLRNVREIPEMVVHICTEDLLHRVNETGTAFPAEVDELAEVGLTVEESVVVRPPRIAQAHVALECQVIGTHELGNGTMVFGEVVHAAFDPDVLAADGLPASELLRPVARMGRTEWGTLGEVIRLARIRLEDWPAKRSPVPGLPAR